MDELLETLKGRFAPDEGYKSAIEDRINRERREPLSSTIVNQYWVCFCVVWHYIKKLYVSMERV